VLGVGLGSSGPSVMVIFAVLGISSTQVLPWVSLIGAPVESSKTIGAV
jgi:hypothetical protein